jgi:TolB protein
MTIRTGIVSLLLLLCGAPQPGAQTPPQPRLPENVSPAILPPAIPLTTPPPTETGERHLTEIRQLTFGGENAEAYWSPDGRELIFQSQRPPYACDQIFRMAIDGGEKVPEARLVSTGRGRTTCSYFLPDFAGARRVIYSSTDAAGAECPPVPDRSQGYVWPIYDSYEIWRASLQGPDGSDRVRLTDNSFYDAESTV